MQNTHDHKSMQGEIQKWFQGEDLVSKNVSKNMIGKKGKSQMNQGKLWDTTNQNNSN
jgi:hypothetical protein